MMTFNLYPMASGSNFQGGVLSGIIFFVAVFISSPFVAVFPYMGLTASILGAGLSAEWRTYSGST